MEDKNDDQDEEGENVDDGWDRRGIHIVRVGVIVRNSTYARSQEVEVSEGACDSLM